MALCQSPMWFQAGGGGCVGEKVSNYITKDMTVDCVTVKHNVLLTVNLNKNVLNLNEAHLGRKKYICLILYFLLHQLSVIEAYLFVNSLFRGPPWWHQLWLLGDLLHNCRALIYREREVCWKKETEKGQRWGLRELNTATARHRSNLQTLKSTYEF